MSDPLKARLPCEHGYWDTCLNYAFKGVSEGQELPNECPGGREVLLVPTMPDYEAMWAVLRAAGCAPLDGLMPDAFAAAVGDTWTIEEIE